MSGSAKSSGPTFSPDSEWKAAASAFKKTADLSGDAVEHVVVIGKVDDLRPGTLRPGERTLLEQLPDQGSPKLNYIQNGRVLRAETRRGVPIRDASINPMTGALRNNTGFLRAEREILAHRGWTYDQKSGYWMPRRGSS